MRCRAKTCGGGLSPRRKDVWPDFSLWSDSSRSATVVV
jgi:hypothetical protein